MRYREPHTTGKKHKGGKKIVDKVAKPFRQCMPFPLPKGSKKSDRQNAGHTNNRVNTIAASSHDAEISPDSGCCISSDDDDTPQPPHQGTTVAKVNKQMKLVVQTVLAPFLHSSFRPNMTEDFLNY